MAKPFIPLSWSLNNSANEKTTAITTLDSFPMDITLSENINNFRFSPKDAAFPHLKSSVIIIVGGYSAPGDVISLTSNVATATLTASSTPSSGEFYTEGTLNNTVAYREMVAESIADTLNKSLSFSNNYEIFLSGTSIFIQAIEFGSNFDFTVTSSTGVVLTESNGSSRYLSQEQIDYSSFAKIYVGDQVYSDPMDKFNATLVDTYTIDSSISEANLTALVVGDFVDAVLPRKALTTNDDYYAIDQGITSAGVSIPSEDSFGNVRLILRPYFIEYGDSFRYVPNGEKKNITKGVTPVRWVQLGAANSLDPYTMQDYVWIPNNAKSFDWLTSCPNNKSITYDSHEFLQVITRKTSLVNNFNMEITYSFYDGTDMIVNQSARSYANIGGNISFDISPSALGLQDLETNQGKLVDRYSVRMLWDASATVTSFSQTKSYVMDRNCYNDKKQVIFLNQFGAWDSLEFKGSTVSTLSRDTTTINRSLPFNANTVAAISSEVALNINTEATSTYELNSGLLSDLHINWVKELGKSSSVYIWEDNAYKNILISDFDYSNDNTVNGNNISITYTYTTSDNTIRR